MGTAAPKALLPSGSCVPLCNSCRYPFVLSPNQLLHVQALLCLPYSFPIDVWSLGVLLAEVALKRPLLICTTPAEAVQAVRWRQGRNVQHTPVLGGYLVPRFCQHSLGLCISRTQRCCYGAQ